MCPMASNENIKVSKNASQVILSDTRGRRIVWSSNMRQIVCLLFVLSVTLLGASGRRKLFADNVQ